MTKKNRLAVVLVCAPCAVQFVGMQRLSGVMKMGAKANESCVDRNELRHHCEELFGSLGDKLAMSDEAT